MSSESFVSSLALSGALRAMLDNRRCALPPAAEACPRRRRSSPWSPGDCCGNPMTRALGSCWDPLFWCCECSSMAPFSRPCRDTLRRCIDIFGATIASGHVLPLPAEHQRVMFYKMHRGSIRRRGRGTLSSTSTAHSPTRCGRWRSRSNVWSQFMAAPKALRHQLQEPTQTPTPV